MFTGGDHACTYDRGPALPEPGVKVGRAGRHTTRCESTDLPAASQWLYDRMDGARGERANRSKEWQWGTFAERTSCHLCWTNQFRLLLASLAYVLLERLRSIGLAGTELARAQVWILRCRLLKVGAVIIRNTRRIRFFLASAFPHQAAFMVAAQRFASG